MMIAVLCLFVATASAKTVTVDKIVNGVDAVSTPAWYVALLKNGNFICGGTAVDPYWVVTAAHCVTDLSGFYQVSVSPSTFDSMSDNLVDAEKVVMHDRYDVDPGFASNDAALVKVKVALPGPFVSLTDAINDYANDQCEIMGYGYDKKGKRKFFMPNVLQETDGVILTTEQCKLYYGSSVTDKNICIHDGSTGSCNGDSGGPMVCYPNGAANDGALAGITSFGVSGCDTAYPSVYTRVSEFREWLLSVMANN